MEAINARAYVSVLVICIFVVNNCVACVWLGLMNVELSVDESGGTDLSRWFDLIVQRGLKGIKKEYNKDSW